MKKLMKKYGHVWILSYVLIYLPWFAALQQNVGKPYHVMHTTLDDLIPFNEYFIVPYLLWFLYVAAAIAYFFFTSKDDYYRLCTFLFTGMTISFWCVPCTPMERISALPSTRIKISSASWWRSCGASIHVSMCSPASMHTTPSESIFPSAAARPFQRTSLWYGPPGS